MKEQSPFCLVWNPDREMPKRKQHDQETATTEAKRLARQNPGEEFFVLICAARVVHGETIVEQFDLDEVPF